MSETLFATSARVTVITGAAGTGKTEELIRCVTQMVAAGEDPADIAVFCATPAACSAFRARLRAALEKAGLAVAVMPQVLTAFECEMAILSLPEARRAINREPRVMLRFEENIFMEDMKTCGVQPKRLGEMLRFFYRSCSDLETFTSSWFYNNEEEKAFRLLGQLQDFYGCYVRQLVPYHAYRFAKDFPRVTAPLTFAHVLVDDYQLLTKASQCLLGLLARETLTVAGDERATYTALEEYPYPDGLSDVRRQNQGCAVVDLTELHAASAVTEPLCAFMADADEVTAEAAAIAAAAAAAAAAAGAGGVQAAGAGAAGANAAGRVGGSAGAGAAAGAAPLSAANLAAETRSPQDAVLRAFARPADEIDGVAALVERFIAEGVPAEDIAVATPRPVWESNLAKALRAAGIPLASMHRANVSGDVRTLETSFEGRVVTLLRLLDDPSNQLALRCWCGFGDYLANSALFADMAKAHVHLSLGTTDITMTAGENALFAQQRDRVLAALASVRELLPRLDGLTGEALVREAARLIDPTAELSPHFLRTFGPLVPNMDAADILESLDHTVFLPRFAHDGTGVRVGRTTDFTGLRPRVMILAGMVNGFTPESRYFDPTDVERDKRPGLLAKEMAKVYAAAGKPDETLLFTYFTAVPLMESEQLRLKMERVRLIDGRRICEVHPSETIRALTGVRFND